MEEVWELEIVIAELEYGQATLEEVQFEWGRNARAVRQKPNVKGRDSLHPAPTVSEARLEVLEEEQEVATDLRESQSEYCVATLSRHTMLAVAVLGAPIEANTAKRSMDTRTTQNTIDTRAPRPSQESKSVQHTIYFCRSCDCSICNACLSQGCLSH